MDWLAYALAALIALAVFTGSSRRRKTAEPAAVPAPLPPPAPPAFDPGPLLAGGLRVEADVTYRDRDFSVTQRRITISAMHGVREEGRAMVRVLRAWCHLRQDTRWFIVNRIDELIDPETGEVADDLPEVGMWLRDKGGLMTRKDQAIRASWREREELAAHVRAEDARRDAIMGGPEIAVAPRAAGLVWRFGHEEDEAEWQRETTELRAIGLDTAGRPSRILVAGRREKARNRTIFVGAGRYGGDRLLVALHVPPEAPAAEDVPALLASLLPQPSHG